MHFGNKAASAFRQPSAYGGLHSSKTHYCFNLLTEGRNINLLSIDYAFLPRLRFRLTLGGFTFPRKP